MAKLDNRRNPISQEHYTKVFRGVMQSAAWRALSPKAQALYPWIKLEWKGDKFNNNGKISLSVAQAANAMGVNVKTATAAFHELQAKGFIENTQVAWLGLKGRSNCHCYLVTELPSRIGGELIPAKRTYLCWKEGRDFDVVKVSAPQKTKKPVPKNGT